MNRPVAGGSFEPQQARKQSLLRGIKPDFANKGRGGNIGNKAEFHGDWNYSISPSFD
jgi:hypothetical protein